MSASNRTGLYVPRDYPDELFYSLAARFVRHLDVRSPKAALRMLYGSTSIIAGVDLPGRFGRLRWLFEERWGIAIEDTIWSMTLLPYYVGKIPQKERQEAIARLVDDQVTGLHTCLGICASQVHQHDFLNLCPVCVEQDVARFGEIYWHRAHQLPGTFVCAEHGVSLATTQVPLRPKGRHEFIAATIKHLQQAGQTSDFYESDIALLKAIAIRGKALLMSERLGGQEFSLSSLQDKLRICGYAHKWGSTARLRKDFHDFYGERILRLMGDSRRNTSSIHWLDSVSRTQRHRLHPLRRILLECFLDYRTQAKQEEPFGAGPWPCLNWHAKHHGQLVVTKIEKVTTKKDGAQPVARFSCDCGFVFTRIEGQDVLEYNRIVKFGPRFINQARSLHEAGYSTHTISKTLGVDWETAARFISQTQSPESEDGSENLTGDQAEWLTIIENANGIGVKQFRARHPALYARLYRANPDWLRTHSPHCVTSGKKRRKRVDWAARDADLVKTLSREAECVRERMPPVRVTANRLASNLGCRALIQKKLQKLPLTKALLERICETPVEFRIRRLRNALAKNPGAPRWKLLRVAAIRDEFATPEVCAAAGLQKPWLSINKRESLE